MMKRKIKLLPIGLTLLLSFVFVNFTTAQDNSRQTDIQQTDEDKLRERLEARRSSLKQRLSDVRKGRIENRCKAAQSRLGHVENRVKDIEISRSQIYNNIVERLTKLSSLLKEKQIDTIELDKQISRLDEMVESFKTGLADYKQVIVDLVVMTCEDDPEGFHASLEEARALRRQLHQSSADIKSYLTETIKPTLQDVRLQLSNKKDE